tara:strand:- start:8080 stop:8964 length:885 start_codon:yes stop_codon:yes gene_type:complete
MLLDFFHPNILALLSAIFVSCTRLTQRYALERISEFWINLIFAVITGIFGWFFYFLDIVPLLFPWEGIFLFMAVGFFSPFAGRYIYLIAIKLTGLARSTIVAQTVLVWSALFAVFVLGEGMTFLNVIGTGLIMFSSMLVVYDGKSAEKRKIPIYYYLVPALSALMYAFSHLIGKTAFIFIPSSTFGMAISNTTCLSILLVMLPFRKVTVLEKGSKKGFIFILLGSVTQSLAILCFWSAMKLGSMTQVIPLSRLSILLIVFLTWLFFREEEKLTYRVFVGAVLALVGACGVVYGR